MDEDLQRELGAGRALGRPDRGDVGQGVFPGEHDQLRAQLPRKLDPSGARDRHLGRAVDGKVGRKRADQAAHAHVLHDRRVGAGGDDPAQVVLGLRQLVGENEGVEGHIAPRRPGGAGRPSGPAGPPG